jgi:hypothetical protein
MLALGHNNNYGNIQTIYFYREHRLVWSALTKNVLMTKFVNLAKYLGVREYMQKPYRYRLQNIMAVYFLFKRE